MNLFARRTPGVLEIHAVFLRPPGSPAREIFYSKLQRTPKRAVFLQDKEKAHGKADACRGLFDAVLLENIRFGAYKSLCEAALWLLFAAEWCA